LKNVSVGNIILSVAGLIPGYWVCFLFIDSWGRKPIQLMVSRIEFGVEVRTMD
jgi:PHS family inorganic phosphate transporter-like MFS transporter